MIYIKGLSCMRKELDNQLKVFHSSSFDDLKLQCDLPYPFERELLQLLKEENKFEQEYYYLEHGRSYAFFIVYKNRMNIFTFGKWKCYFNLQVIGFPCSLSNGGYVTNDLPMMLAYIRSLKGAKLVLNAPNPLRQAEGEVQVNDVQANDVQVAKEALEVARSFTVGETLPTCMFENRFTSVEEYLGAFRSNYRRRINLAKAACQDIVIKDVLDNSVDIYPLYLNTYEKSDYKLEKLERGFFERVDADKIAFFKGNVPLGFVMLKQVDAHLIFMLCGMDYRYETVDLYYYMLLYIVEYAIEHHCKTIDFGQTSEATKLKFGAVLEKKYFYAHHSNPILNGLVKVCKSMLEYRYQFPEFRVFRDML